MKKTLFSFLAIILLLCSCDNKTKEGSFSINTIGDYNIVEIDKCEYIEYDQGLIEYRVYSLTHKGNCKYCKERNNLNNN